MLPSETSAAWNPSFDASWRRIVRMNSTLPSSVSASAQGSQRARYSRLASISRYSSSASDSSRRLRSRTSGLGVSPAHECLDRIGEVHGGDVVFAALEPEPL